MSAVVLWPTPECVYCGLHSEVALPVAGFVDWREGALIQHAFPQLSADERELLMTGIHGPCWDTILRGDG